MLSSKGFVPDEWGSARVKQDSAPRGLRRKHHAAFLCVCGAYSTDDPGAQMETECLERGAHTATCIPGVTAPHPPQSKSSF